MPKSCCAFSCSNHNMMKERMSFFKFPKDLEKWIIAVNRQNEDGSLWRPTKILVLCDHHFITGLVNKDPLHPDWVPPVFTHRQDGNKPHDRMNRYKNAKKRSLQGVIEHLSNKPQVLSEIVANQVDSVTNHKSWVSILPPVAAVSSTPTLSPTSSQQESAEINDHDLHEELAIVKARVAELEVKLSCAKLSSKCVEGDNSKCMFYTGLQWDQFLAVFHYLQKFCPRPSTRKGGISLQDQLFLTLVKLRLDLHFQHIAYQCGMGLSTVIEIFWRWIDLMYVELSWLIKWPDRDAVFESLPIAFKELYPRLTSIVDCFELFIDQPKNLKARAQTYSNYKKHCTAKVFIACTPCGAVSFVSKAWGGRASDAQIVRQNGFVSTDLHQHGDQILADRGFTVQDDLATVCGAELIIPSFTKGHNQLPAEDVEVS